MKKALIFGILLTLFIGCENNKGTSDKNNTELTSSTKDTNIQDTTENDSPKEVEKTPAAEKNCGTSKIDVYLDDPDNSGTNIRKSPGGTVVTKLVKNNEDIEFFLTLTDAKDGWFKVKNPIGGMENDIKIPNGEGWIHGSVISVDTRNYGGQELKLLDQPENGNVVGVIKEEAYGLKIKDFCGVWVKVAYKGTIGWIEASWLCGNPLTTCS